MIPIWISIVAVTSPCGFSFFLSLTVLFFLFFFFNDTATTEIYTLSLHDALPISPRRGRPWPARRRPGRRSTRGCCSTGSRRSRSRCSTRSRPSGRRRSPRSEEHTSELQSPDHLVCRLLLEKKKNDENTQHKM